MMRYSILGNDFSIERYLESRESTAPRRNLTDFLAYKEKISEAAEKYSMRQIWTALTENGKYSGSYNSFTYYFRRFIRRAKVNDGKTPESILIKESKSCPDDLVAESKQGKLDKRGKKPFYFEIPKDSEEKL